MLLRNKKAMERESLWWFIDLFMLLMIIYLVFSHINRIGEQKTFQQRFLANDLALMVDTLYASPGNIYINYPQNTLWFGISFTKNKVEIFENKKDPANLKESANFIEDNHIVFEHKLFAPTEKQKSKETFVQKYLPVFYLLKRKTHGQEDKTLDLTFIKDHNEIKILDTKTTPIINILNCNSINKKFGIIFITDTNNENFFQLASPILGIVGKIISKDELSSIRLNDDSLFFYISIKENTDYDYIKSYFDAESGEKSLHTLSCNIVNDILSAGFGEETEAASIPQNKITLTNKLALEKDSNIMILELSKKESFTEDDFQLIRKSIYSTLSNIED